MSEQIAHIEASIAHEAASATAAQAIPQIENSVYNFNAIISASEPESEVKAHDKK